MGSQFEMAPGWWSQALAIAIVFASVIPFHTTAAAQEQSRVVGPEWHWRETRFSDGTEFVPADDARYTLTFSDDGMVHARADCNVANGSYTVSDDEIEIRIGAMTRAYCGPDSLSDTYVQQLGRVSRYSLRGGILLLEFPFDSGTMRFATPFNSGAEQVTTELVGQPDPQERIKFDLGSIDGTGLTGPPDGLVAVAYEFCIPAAPEYLAEVQGIDPTVRAYPGSPGRIQCGSDEILCIGSTYQENWRSVLLDLASLAYVSRIDRSYAE